MNRNVNYVLKFKFFIPSKSKLLMISCHFIIIGLIILIDCAPNFHVLHVGPHVVCGTEEGLWSCPLAVRCTMGKWGTTIVIWSLYDQIKNCVRILGTAKHILSDCWMLPRLSLVSRHSQAGEFLAWEPQNYISSNYRWRSSFDFIRLCIRIVCSWMWSMKKGSAALRPQFSVGKRWIIPSILGVEVAVDPEHTGGILAGGAAICCWGEGHQVNPA